ncbi:MAG: acyl-CoA dehydrogenase family protein [Proteobacteria bacterium]|nr:acyl-CoA dehydrogenase family protein [Pseudomonadota bacterium]MBU1695840.1 acyl-CoA dehydrogenase family protein [Pseudomonadota bacterium]
MASILDLRKKYLGAADATDEDMRIVQAVREYVDKEIMPRRQDLDGGWHRNEELARKTFEKVHQGLVDIGVQKAIWPESLGGLNVSSLAFEMVIEEISRGDAGLATHIGIVNWTMLPAHLGGRTDLLQEFIPKICDDKPHGCCMAITEPSGGTNTEDPTQHGRTIQTIASLEGDEWVINGHKIWPSGASIADITYCVVCTTDPGLGDDGVALIYVPPEAKGMSFSTPFQKMGMCWTDTNTEIFFDNVRVPKKNRVAGPGRDNKILHDIVGFGRIGTCGFALGAAQACFEIVLDWTKNREIAGRPVRNRSLHAYILGEMAQKIESARAYSMQTYKMVRQSKLYGKPGESFLLSKCSAAKEYNCEVSIWVANKAMELMGSYGYAFEYNVEKYLRDIKILQLWLGGPQRALLDTALGYYSFEW